MLELSPEQKLGQAHAMMRGFESAYAAAQAEGIDITAHGWRDFSKRMQAPFAPESQLRRLAFFAIEDAGRLITDIQKGLPKNMPLDRRRALLHANASSILEPSHMTDGRKNLYFDYVTPEHVDYRPGIDADPGELSWLGLDLEVTAPPNRGCPAHHLAPSDALPAPSTGEQPPSFINQFFHLAIDTLINAQEKRISS